MIIRVEDSLATKSSIIVLMYLLSTRLGIDPMRSNRIDSITVHNFFALIKASVGVFTLCWYCSFLALLATLSA